MKIIKQYTLWFLFWCLENYIDYVEENIYIKNSKCKNKQVVFADSCFLSDLTARKCGLGY